jgi:hypothetical protein
MLLTTGTSSALLPVGAASESPALTHTGHMAAAVLFRVPRFDGAALFRLRVAGQPLRGA